MERCRTGGSHPSFTSIRRTHTDRACLRDTLRPRFRTSKCLSTLATCRPPNNSSTTWDTLTRPPSSVIACFCHHNCLRKISTTVITSRTRPLCCPTDCSACSKVTRTLTHCTVTTPTYQTHQICTLLSTRSKSPRLPRT